MTDVEEMRAYAVQMLAIHAPTHNHLIRWASVLEVDQARVAELEDQVTWLKAIERKFHELVDKHEALEADNRRLREALVKISHEDCGWSESEDIAKLALGETLT